MQRSFGDFDIGGVRSRVGGAAGDAATVLGARAYAIGESVGFDRAPDLRTSAHEMAHVLGQRVGFMPAGARGRPGDRYERFADQVADTVVAGRSAEGLLERSLGRGAARPRADGGRRPVQLVIGEGKHGAIVRGPDEALFVAESLMSGQYLLRYVKEQHKSITVERDDPAYSVFKEGDDAAEYLKSLKPYNPFDEPNLITNSNPFDDDFSDDFFLSKPSLEKGPSLSQVLDDDPFGLGHHNNDSDSPDNPFVSFFDNQPIKKPKADAQVLNRQSLKAKGGGRDKFSKLRSRATLSLSKTNYTELLNALDAYGTANSTEDEHRALAEIIGHAQRWLATHPWASLGNQDTKAHRERFDAIEEVRNAARVEFMALSGIVASDVDDQSSEERLMFLLDDILRDPLYAEIYDAMHHGTAADFGRWFKKPSNYLKVVPLANIGHAFYHGQVANKRKERSRAIEEAGRDKEMLLVEHLGHALAEHYIERRKKQRITGTISAITTPLSVVFPISGAAGLGASALTDLSGQAIAKSIDKPIEKLSSFAVQKGSLAASKKAHQVKGGQELVRAFAAHVARFTVDKDAARALVLYLGLPKRAQDSPQEKSRLALKAMMGAETDSDLLDEQFGDDDQTLQAMLESRKDGKKDKNKGQFELFFDDDVDWLRALWMSEGFQEGGRRAKGSALKLAKQQADESNDDDDGLSLLSGLDSGKSASTNKSKHQGSKSMFSFLSKNGSNNGNSSPEEQGFASQMKSLFGSKLDDIAEEEDEF